MSLYGLLWRLLPGPIWLRILLAIVLALAIVVACFQVAFPLLDRLFSPEEALGRS